MERSHIIMVLVIRRREAESLLLQHPAFGSAEITVYALENKRVKLGISAPMSVNIVRSELLEKTAEQGEAESQQKCPDIWLKADRETAKSQARSLGRSYIEDLEAVAKLSNLFWDAMAHKTQSPEQHQLSDQLLDALGKVNFLS